MDEILTVLVHSSSTLAVTTSLLDSVGHSRHLLGAVGTAAKSRGYLGGDPGLLPIGWPGLPVCEMGQERHEMVRVKLCLLWSERSGPLS